MSRAIARLATERMSEDALWHFVIRALPDVGPGSLLEYDQRKSLFKNLDAAIEELYLRGHQLELPLEFQTPESSS